MFILICACVFVFGTLVGIAELASRHSDHRLLAIVSLPSLAYLAFNGILSLAALAVIELARPDWLGFAKDGDGNALLVVLTAGFSASLFFRSSIFRIKTGEVDMSVGPVQIIDIFLKLIDEAVDRSIGAVRQVEIARIMADIDFDKAAKNLPTLCFRSLKRLSNEDQEAFAKQLRALDESKDLLPQVRGMSLGMAIMALTGSKILEQGVKQLFDRIKIDPPQTGAQ